MSDSHATALLEGGEAHGRMVQVDDLVGDDHQRALHRGPGRGWTVYRRTGRLVHGAGAPCEVWQHRGGWAPYELDENPNRQTSDIVMT